MKTVDKYIADLRKMFFISVDNDIDKWNKESELIIKGPYFGWKNNFIIDTNKCKLILHMNDSGISGEKVISEYEGVFRCKDKEVLQYVKKLQQHFKQLEEDKKNKEAIEFFKTGLDCLNKQYPKQFEQEVRKEKLNSLK